MEIFIKILKYHKIGMNTLPFSLLGFGFLLGLKHSFDVDHIVAISAISSKTETIKKSSLVGMLWGIGHTISLFITGLIVLLFKILIPEKLALLLELIAGLMLIILGLNILIRINRDKIHFHKHKHGKAEHIHLHSHLTTKNHNHSHRPLLIGLIHGLAGSAALTLLILTTIDSIFAGIFYISIFSIASIIGMIVVSNIVSFPFRLIPSRFKKTHKILLISTSLTSLIMGFNILHQTIKII